jgi:ABC-2 type transport system permease protein
MSAWSNIGNIARREYLVRVRTRSFVLGTLVLIAGVALIAMLPVIIRGIDRVDATKLVVVAEDQALATSSAATISVLLNASTGVPDPSGTTTADFVITTGADLDEARAAVTAGTYEAALAIERGPSGEPDYTLYTDENAVGRSAQLVRQAVNALAVADRLERLGIEPPDQAGLFAPAQFTVESPDPNRAEGPRDTAAAIGQDMLAFGMTILIFMIIIMYGNWVSMSVVEEKSSRVMEVILNAATPFQLLAGKVFGVGALAFTQYAAIVLAGVVAIVVQGPVATAVLGGSASMDLPQGLSPALLLAFGAYGVLGFLLYAALFAAAGSLVSRQEDVNAAVMPLTLLSVAGYMIGVYASMGLIDVRAGWIMILTLIPLFSPFMMLGRMAVGAAAPWEVVLSLVLLVAAVGVAIWVASRIYSVGVLLYGTRPGARTVWRLLREGM